MPLSPAFRFELISVPYVWHDADQAFPGLRAINPDTHIIHVLQGRGIMRINDQSLPITAGQAYWIPQSASYVCGKQAGEPLEMINLHFHLEMLSLPSGSLLHMPGRFDLSTRTRTQLRRLLKAWQSDDLPQRGRAFVMAHQIVMEHVGRVGQVRTAREAADPRMTRLRQLLHQQADQPYNAAHFAQQIHLSVSQMNRCFAQTFSLSPRAYHEQRRLAHVQALLQQTDLPIKTLAEELGFCDPFYFCRWFTRHTSQPPTRFRQQRWRM